MPPPLRRCDPRPTMLSQALVSAPNRKGGRRGHEEEAGHLGLAGKSGWVPNPRKQDLQCAVSWCYFWTKTAWLLGVFSSSFEENHWLSFRRPFEEQARAVFGRHPPASSTVRIEWKVITPVGRSSSIDPVTHFHGEESKHHLHIDRNCFSDGSWQVIRARSCFAAVISVPNGTT